MDDMPNEDSNGFIVFLAGMVIGCLAGMFWRELSNLIF